MIQPNHAIPSPNEIREFCVYLQVAADGTNYYLGQCRTLDLMRFPDARNNAKWIADYMSGEQPRLSTYVILMSDNAIDCTRQKHIAYKHYKPLCNVESFKYANRNARGVLCVQTGERYRTAAEAAKMNGISQPNLSEHLSGKRKHVKGLTFIREFYNV